MPDFTKMDDSKYREYLKSVSDYDLKQMLDFVNPQAFPGRFEAVVEELRSRKQIDPAIQIDEIRARQGELLIREYLIYSKWKLIIGLVLAAIAALVLLAKYLMGTL